MLLLLQIWEIGKTVKSHEMTVFASKENSQSNKQIIEFTVFSERTKHKEKFNRKAGSLLCAALFAPIDSVQIEIYIHSIIANVSFAVVVVANITALKHRHEM